MKLFRRDPGLDAPRSAGARGPGAKTGVSSNERFGRWTESIARGMGTPWFLLILTCVCIAWLAWNTFGPERWRFDSAALGFTALTLILSLQASYAAPMILLAQNRQDDRDRVQMEQDRQRSERALADTEFLAREVVALRLAMKDLPDREFLRAELRALLAELETDPGLDATPLPVGTAPSAASGAEPGVESGTEAGADARPTTNTTTTTTTTSTASHKDPA